MPPPSVPVGTLSGDSEGETEEDEGRKEYLLLPIQFLLRPQPAQRGGLPVKERALVSQTTIANCPSRPMPTVILSSLCPSRSQVVLLDSGSDANL